MPKAKRLAIIEDNNPNEAPQITHLLHHIRVTQQKLIKETYNDKDLTKAFNDLVMSHLLNAPTQITFNSIESVNQTFDNLQNDFKSASQALGMSQTYQPLCLGLQLFIELYRIQAMEAFLYKPLAKELIPTENKLEPITSLRDRFDQLIQKINYFNLQIEEIDQGLEYYKLPRIDMQATDLKEMLQPLLAEESRLNMLPNQAKKLEQLEKDRLILVKNLDDLNQEMERDILDCEESLKKAKEKREKLYESTLGIDVYYLDEFKNQNKEIFESYKKVLMRSQCEEFSKIAAIEKHIQPFANSFRIFELSLNEYYTNISTLYYTISSYLPQCISTFYCSIIGVYELLTAQFSAFKLNSSILKLEVQYHEPFEYLRVGLPEVEKIIEENFVSASKKYLTEIATLDEASQKNLASQAKDAFDNDVLNETLRIRPSNLIPAIKSFAPKALRRDRLNINWEEVFRHIVTKELQDIKSEFDVLVKQSSSDLMLFNKMVLRLKVKREALDAILDNDLYPNVCEILDVVFLEANLDPIILAVRNRIKNLEESKLLPKVENKPIPVEDCYSPKPCYSHLRVNDKNKLTNKSWKRALIFGLLTFVCVMLAFTLWGVIAEVAAAAILIPGLGFGGIGFTIVGGVYYACQENCCKKIPPEEDALPSPATHQIQLTPISTIKNSDNKQVPYLSNRRFGFFDNIFSKNPLHTPGTDPRVARKPLG